MKHRSCRSHLQVQPNLLWHLCQCRRRNEAGALGNAIATLLLSPLIEHVVIQQNFPSHLDLLANPLMGHFQYIICWKLVTVDFRLFSFATAAGNLRTVGFLARIYYLTGGVHNSEYGTSCCWNTGETKGDTRTGEAGFEHGVPEYFVTIDNNTNTICTFESFHPIMQPCCHCWASRAKINITLLLIVLFVAAPATCHCSIWSRSSSCQGCTFASPIRLYAYMQD